MKKWLRQLVARCFPIERWSSENVELLAWLGLVALVPTSIITVTISIAKSELSLIDFLAILLTLLTVVTAVLLVAKRLDMLTRSIGGLKQSDLHELSKPISPYSLSFAAEADIPQIATFADEYYLGTMPAGRGPMRNERLQARIEMYRRKYEGFRHSFCCLKDKSGTLVGFTMTYPVKGLAIDRYLNGTLAYTDFHQSEMRNDGDGSAIFIAVTLATDESILDQEKRGLDLLGQAVVRHIAEVEKRCNFEKLRIVTSGLGYWGNKAFKKKGFVKHSRKDRDGLTILVLEQCREKNEAGRLFFKEINALASLKSSNVKE